ncbi:MAG: hypothetical protein DMG65_07095 [Candidatus Angelobacter sp. Gp1-AA117]|nr:MAG: hypothetical protein DMG65_07095 [Candidatus Angelobacter sp. Gp1-AA117]
MGPQQRRLYRLLYRLLVLLIDIPDGNAHQFLGHLRMNGFDRLMGAFLAVNSGQSPVPVFAGISLQGTDISQFFDQRGQRTQSMFLEIFSGVGNHIRRLFSQSGSSWACLHTGSYS